MEDLETLQLIEKTNETFIEKYNNEIKILKVSFVSDLTKLLTEYNERNYSASTNVRNEYLEFLKKFNAKNIEIDDYNNNISNFFDEITKITEKYLNHNSNIHSQILKIK